MKVGGDNNHCDWCGQEFVDGEPRVAGYEDEPTHKGCAREARRAWRQDQMKQSGSEYDPYARPDREPFTDWPNGQGTYD